MSHPPSARTGEMPNLDMMRALAVLLVLADHVLETIGHQIDHAFTPFAWYIGRLGVLIFFVHTSLVLMWSMQRLNLTGWELVKSFYIRRAFRIYPLSVICVLGVVLIGIPVLPWKAFEPADAQTLTANLLLTMNITDSKRVLAPLWSLPYEVQMYLALPAIFILLGNAAPSWRTIALYGASVVAGWLLPPLSPLFSVATFAPCFMAGVIAFQLQRGDQRQAAAIFWPLLLAAIVLGYVVIENLTPGIHHNLLTWFTCLLLGIMIPRFRQIEFAPVNLATHLIAKYSYGIYLFHCVALWFGLYTFDLPAPAQWLIAAVTLVALSVAGYHLIEKPAIDFGAKLARRGHPQKSAAHESA